MLKFSFSVLLSVLFLSFLNPQSSSAQSWTIGDGIGSNGNQEYPAPFGNYFHGARHQFIYRASELLSAGATAGDINRFGFNIITINDITPYQGFTIHMKNSLTDSLGEWETGMKQVVLPVVYNQVPGWNMFTLDSVFTWDGTSNIIVEVCFNNTAYTLNASTEWTTNLPVGSSRFYYEDAGGVCGNPLVSDVSSARPNARFYRNADQQYVSSTCTNPFQQTTTMVPNVGIIGIQVVAEGSTAPMNITKFELNTEGSSYPEYDITTAKIYYTGASSAFDTVNLYGSYNLPNGDFEITGTRALADGINHFWLTYDVPDTALKMDTLDAQCTALTIGDSVRIPTVTAPAGYRVIMPPFGGTYYISAFLFREASGKNLTFKEVISDEGYKQSSRYSPSKNRGQRDIMSSPKSIRDYDKKFVPYLDGKEYKGSLYKSLTDAQRTKYGITDGMGGGVYPTITAALEDFNMLGCIDSTVFVLMDTMYFNETFPLTIDPLVNKPTAVNNFSIIPDVGIPATIYGTGESILKTVDVSYVNIGGPDGGMVMVNEEIDRPVVLHLSSRGTDISSNISIEGCQFIGVDAADDALGIYLSDESSSAPGNFSNISILNNSILYVNRGIVAWGGDEIEQNIDGISIVENYMTELRSEGVILQGVTNGLVSQNFIGEFDHTEDYSDIGVFVYLGTTNTIVESNDIFSLGHDGTGGYGASGVIVATQMPNNNNIIRSNLIYDLYGDGWAYTNANFWTDNVYGVLLVGQQSGIKIYNNSFNFFGNTLNQTNAISACVGIGTQSSADIRNNSMVNNLGRLGALGFGSMAIFMQGTQAVLTNSNYNNYYVNPSGSGQKIIAKRGATNYATLTAFRTFTTRDQYSVTGDPAYFDNYDLYPDDSNPACWVNYGSGLAGLIPYGYCGCSIPQSVSEGTINIGAIQDFIPSVEPPATIQSGTITQGSTTTYSAFGRQLCAITWDTTSVDGPLPDTVRVIFNSGVVPPGTLTGDYSMGYWSVYANVASGYTYDVMFNYTPAMLFRIPNQGVIRLAKYDSGAWEFLPTSIVDSIASTVRMNGLHSFSDFALTSLDAPLPVELASFTHSVVRNNVELNWKTVTELNNSGFEIERKISGSDAWTKVGHKDGAGNSNVSVDYNFEDRNLTTAKYNYRLKQIDFNGNHNYIQLTALVDVGIPMKYDLSQNYPNPFNPTTKINYALPFDSKVSILLYDMLGREITKIVNETKQAGYYTVQFNGSNLASGIYFYNIIAEGGNSKFITTKKMVLVK